MFFLSSPALTTGGTSRDPPGWDQFGWKGASVRHAARYSNLECISTRSLDFLSFEPAMELVPAVYWQNAVTGAPSFNGFSEFDHGHANGDVGVTRVMLRNPIVYYVLRRRRINN